MQNERIKHLDLFSGIGGFAIAAEMAFGEVDHIFCDNEAFAQAVLRKHWPNAPIHDDIRTLDGTKLGHIDLLTGGFPCQPFSAAGRRRGTEDDRHLWPEMLRVIREVRPTYVLGENVGGFLTWDGGMVFEQVCADLEKEGYEVCPLVIPACAVNAPHRRDRVWIAAHAIGSDAVGTPRQLHGSESEERLSERHQVGELGEPGGARLSPNAGSQRRQQIAGSSPRNEGEDEGRSSQDHHELAGGGEGNRHASDTQECRWSEGQQECRGTREGKGTQGQRRGLTDSRSSWAADWPAVAARLCTLDDGLPNGLARPRGWRNAALKGAGNAIVPQVAAEILSAMRVV